MFMKTNCYLRYFYASNQTYRYPFYLYSTVRYTVAGQIANTRHFSVDPDPAFKAAADADPDPVFTVVPMYIYSWLRHLLKTL